MIDYNIVMWVIQFNTADWVFSKTLTFAGDFEDSKSTSGWILCIFGSRTCVPKSWMCKKQTSVYHSSTGSEIISLDAGLRMDGITTLDLWDVVIEVLHSSNNVPPIQKISTPKSKPRGAAGNCVRDNVRNIRLMKECDRNVHQLSELDYVTTNAHIILREKPSYAFLKTTKLWSRLSSKEEVRWWDTRLEPTGSR